MNEDIKDFFPCDAETELNKSNPDYHAYLELETVFHPEMKETFLSFFTKRDGVGSKEVGTEVWLDIDSVHELIGELSQWALNNGTSLAEIADLVGLSLEEEKEGFISDDFEEEHPLWRGY